jgi:Ser-tRNA(Ala) deacylase AlaX
MELKIDLPQRYAKMRAHTATHLLHAQLAKIFPNTKQA